MVSTEIRLIIFSAAKDGEALYSQQKQDWELTVAQITNSLFPNAATAAKSLQSCPTLCDPHRLQPTRLRCLWDSPGKNTGVGCHFLLQCMKEKTEDEVAQLCPTPSDPMDCSLPVSSIHGFSRQEYWSGVPLPSPPYFQIQT